MLRSAATLEAAVSVLQPTSRPKLDATYAVNASGEPLPARRGAGVMVWVTAVRLDRPFTVADVTAALPEVKSARYWVNRLVKSGHLSVVG